MQSAKRLILFILKHYLFWLTLFAFGRIVFLLWNREELIEIPTGEILLSFFKGLYVDTAMACYLLVIPFLFALFSAVNNWSWPVKLNRAVHLILFFVFFLITFSELPIYDEWHTKLNYKALWFFMNPSEVFHTASTAQLILPIAFSAALSYLCFRLHRKFISEQFNSSDRNIPFVTSMLVIPASLVIGIRGGFQTIPVQLSDAYYSSHNILNLASVNSLFNLSSSCIENAKAGEPYEFLPEWDRKTRFDAMFASVADSNYVVLNTQRPNIVLVVLEGWSADMVQSLGGINEVNIAPNFDTLVRNGISFDRCYASGALSDQGMAAVFSAFPAQPLTSVITQPNKYVKLPCLSKKLKAAGYSTSFMFGGQLSYGNIRSYMYFNEFDQIIEGEHFDETIPQGKLGVHDQFLFDRQLKELHTQKEPFFAALFTLSTHGPYDFPPGRDLNYGDKEGEYVNSIHYANSCIGDFIRRAKKEPWYDNTLFVFISDHSHNSPKNYNFRSPEYRRIPWVFYGNVIDSNRRSYRIPVTVSQTDLAATLLGQIGIDHSEFKYSRDQFSYTTNKSAYYSFEEGFGFVRDDASIYWDVSGNAVFDRSEGGMNVYSRTEDSLALLKNGQAILQTLSADYSRY